MPKRLSRAQPEKEVEKLRSQLEEKPKRLSRAQLEEEVEKLRSQLKEKPKRFNRAQLEEDAVKLRSELKEKDEKAEWLEELTMERVARRQKVEADIARLHEAGARAKAAMAQLGAQILLLKSQERSTQTTE
ncbi:uncharacterized protein LOC100900340 [Galendromus occidentalis]|uniref:Uncharacterized protein LOC100900340 n=1 Tax=Galendromus occidentalis TaxID=34638 RepID=A0AAJ7P9Q3_9ACAR|nr:uncharacterized protein LOC100900340 [Galendromus occidentalis]